MRLLTCSVYIGPPAGGTHATPDDAAGAGARHSDKGKEATREATPRAGHGVTPLAGPLFNTIVSSRAPLKVVSCACLSCGQSRKIQSSEVPILLFLYGFFPTQFKVGAQHPTAQFLFRSQYSVCLTFNRPGLTAVICSLFSHIRALFPF